MEKSIMLPVTFTIYFSRILDKATPETPLNLMDRMKKLAPPCSNLDADIFQTSREERDADIVTEYTIILCMDKEIEYETEGTGITHHETEKDLIGWARNFMSTVFPKDNHAQQFELEEVELSECKSILEIILALEERRMVL